MSDRLRNFMERIERLQREYDELREAGASPATLTDVITPRVDALEKQLSDFDKSFKPRQWNPNVTVIREGEGGPAEIGAPAGRPTLRYNFRE